MRFSFTEDQLAYRDAARNLFATQCFPSVVRASWDSSTGLNPVLWANLGEMGVLGMLVGERSGGLGLSFIDMVLVLEEAGYAGVPDPILEHGVVGLPLLAELGASDTVLAAALAGTSVVSVFGFDHSRYVSHADQCAVLVAALPDGLHLIPSPIGSARRVETVDRAIRLFAPDGVALSSLSSIGARARGDQADRLVAAAFNRGALGSAALLVGAARRCLDMTVAYVTQRQQFGVPVGSFQGLKHQLASALMQLEFARPLVYRAAQSISVEAGSVDRDVSMAKAMATDAAKLVARTALQAHGAIGYTVEYDLHLWFKRIFGTAALWGDSAWHTNRVGLSLGI